MGMTVTVEITDSKIPEGTFEKIFNYFEYIDDAFSTYKKTSEISLINQGVIKKSDYSEDMQTVLRLSEETKNLTGGFFDIKRPDGSLDPSGLVKGWAIHNAALILKKEGVRNFYVDAGGDIQVSGENALGEPWEIGIRNPFNPEKEIVKVVSLTTEGLATSGTYVRGDHIYNPHDKTKSLAEIVSLSVVGPNIYEADRFATAAFAMGKEGINFIEKLEGFEGYMIDRNGIAVMTSDFLRYT